MPIVSHFPCFLSVQGTEPIRVCTSQCPSFSDMQSLASGLLLVAPSWTECSFCLSFLEKTAFTKPNGWKNEFLLRFCPRKPWQPALHDHIFPVFISMPAALRLCCECNVAQAYLR